MKVQTKGTYLKQSNMQLLDMSVKRLLNVPVMVK